MIVSVTYFVMTVVIVTSLAVSCWTLGAGVMTASAAPAVALETSEEMSDLAPTMTVVENGMTEVTVSVTKDSVLVTKTVE